MAPYGNTSPSSISLFCIACLKALHGLGVSEFACQNAAGRAKGVKVDGGQLAAKGIQLRRDLPCGDGVLDAVGEVLVSLVAGDETGDKRHHVAEPQAKQQAHEGRTWGEGVQDQQGPAGPQHSHHLLKGAANVWEVPEGVHRQDTIEAVVLVEPHVADIAAPVSAAWVGPPRDVQHPLTAVQALYLQVEGSVFPVQVLRHPACPAAHIQDCAPWDQSGVQVPQSHIAPEGGLAEGDEPIEGIVALGDGVKQLRDEPQLLCPLQSRAVLGAEASEVCRGHPPHLSFFVL
eukprot:CAMPEP_0117672426 /NCGR_PEP_ID=MMETSP0804-20121206/13899_1 /TAXON_ID=1074897 /ORGANISM="Tetraselmis astigmatica, Strain CCMP880" /LENGTH=287 /DNA_ID=CAMNT_0005481029 /DNA_START=27 /DNA_END=890 /DNA_ORIENTATION=-